MDPNSEGLKRKSSEKILLLSKTPGKFSRWSVAGGSEALSKRKKTPENRENSKKFSGNNRERLENLLYRTRQNHQAQE